MHESMSELLLTVLLTVHLVCALKKNSGPGSVNQKQSGLD